MAAGVDEGVLVASATGEAAERPRRRAGGTGARNRGRQPQMPQEPLDERVRRSSETSRSSWAS